MSRAGEPPFRQSIAETIAREGARLAAELPPPSERSDNRGADAWADVRRVPAGREVIVTTGRDRSAAKVFVAADDSGLTVLKLTSPQLSRELRRVLIALATNHPDVLLGAGAYEDPPRGVVFNRAGLFVGSRLVEERSHLLERIERDELHELRLAQPGGSYWKLGAWIGAGAGALIWYGLASNCGPGAVPTECSAYAMMSAPLGAAIGAGAGGVLGARQSRPSSRLIYLAP